MTRRGPTLQPVLQWSAFALFAFTVLLSIVAVNLRVGPIPVRSITLLLSGLLLFVTDAALLRETLRRIVRLAVLIVAVAALGLVVSMLAKTAIAATIEQIVEIHVQAVIGTVIACGLMLRFGIPRVVGCLVAAFAVSVVFGIGQALHIGAAWDVRAAIGRLMNDPPLTQITYLSRYRALGLSLTPVHFGTQSCLVLAALLYARLSRFEAASYRIDWAVMAGVVVLIALSVLTGNRSPLLGFVVFTAAYILVTAPRLALATLPVIVLAALAVGPLLRSLSEAGVRVAETGDGSASGRETLRAFGLFLIGQRPIGYGLTFNSMDHWQSFAHGAAFLPNWEGIRLWAIHNYYILTLAKYGVLIVSVVPVILPRSRRIAFLWLPFIAYLIHIYYHNDGPLQGDFMFFYIIPAALIVAERWRLTADKAEKATRKQTWRRAFAAPQAAA